MHTRKIEGPFGRPEKQDDPAQCLVPSSTINTRSEIENRSHELNSTNISFGKRYPMAAGFAASSMSVATATFLTNWIDVIKVRQQLAGHASTNMVRTAVDVVRTEGILALNRGVTAAVARGMLYGGMRIGLYSPLKDAMMSWGFDRNASSFDHNHGQNNHGIGILVKIGAGMTSGSIAAAACNPTDLVKTRMQVAGAGTASPIQVAQRVIREEGIQGLWKGTIPSMTRAALLTAAQCATYDEVKSFFTQQLAWHDGIATHVVVSGVAGLVTTTVIAPVDMVKTHMFVNTGGTNSVWKCFVDIYSTQGIRGLFKGWGANWARQGPMTTVVFVANEAIRPLFGLDAL